METGQIECADGVLVTTTISELQGDVYALVSDSQEVAAVRESIADKTEYDGYLVIAEDGEYKEVWGFFGTVAYLYKTAYRCEIEKAASQSIVAEEGSTGETPCECEVCEIFDRA